jgi:glycosyl transferase, family 25
MFETLRNRLSPTRGINRCDVVYINLRHRTDRRAEIESELSRIRSRKYVRFDGIRAEPGWLGCSLSHRAVLSAAKVKPGRLLMVVEDDCQFLKNSFRVGDVIEDFSSSKADVLCLSFNASQFEPLPTYNKLRRVFNARTTSCYILKTHMIEPIRAMANLSVDLFDQGLPSNLAAFDMVWRRMQKENIFVVPRERLARQRASYSDIEGHFADHGV